MATSSCVVQLNSRQIQLNLRLALHRFVRRLSWLVDSCIPIGGFLHYPSCGRLLQRHIQVIKAGTGPGKALKGIADVAGGFVGAVTSPIMGAFRSLVSS